MLVHPSSGASCPRWQPLDHPQPRYTRHVRAEEQDRGQRDTRQQQERALSALSLLLLLNIHTFHLTTITLLCVDMTLLACSMSKDGPEVDILGVEQWRGCGDTPTKFPHEKSLQKEQNSAFRHVALYWLLHFEHSSMKMGSQKSLKMHVKCCLDERFPPQKLPLQCEEPILPHCIFYDQHCIRGKSILGH